MPQEIDFSDDESDTIRLHERGDVQNVQISLPTHTPNNSAGISFTIPPVLTVRVRASSPLVDRLEQARPPGEAATVETGYYRFSGVHTVEGFRCQPNGMPYVEFELLAHDYDEKVAQGPEL